MKFFIFKKFQYFIDTNSKISENSENNKKIKPIINEEELLEPLIKD